MPSGSVVGSSTTSRPSRTRALIVMEASVALDLPPNKRLHVPRARLEQSAGAARRRRARPPAGQPAPRRRPGRADGNLLLAIAHLAGVEIEQVEGHEDSTVGRVPRSGPGLFLVPASCSDAPEIRAVRDQPAQGRAITPRANIRAHNDMWWELECRWPGG